MMYLMGLKVYEHIITLDEEVSSFVITIHSEAHLVLVR